LAGKFEKICTAFPLATFLAKNSKWLPLKISRQKYVNITSCKKNMKAKRQFRPSPEKFKAIFLVLSSLPN